MRFADALGMPGTFSSLPRVSDPKMHHGTCVTHVSWCMPGLLPGGLPLSLWRGKRSRHSRRMYNPQFTYMLRAHVECRWFYGSVSKYAMKMRTILWSNIQQLNILLLNNMFQRVTHLSNERFRRNPATVLMAKLPRKHTLWTPLSIEQWYIYGISPHWRSTESHGSL